MTDYLLRTKKVVDDCEEHLKSSDSADTDIESYLTQHILVLLCADIQQEIYRIAGERASQLSGIGVSDYLSSSGQYILRSANREKITNYVSLFGTKARLKFVSKLDGVNVEAYDNAVKNRIKVAHKHGAQVSFPELKRAVEVAVIVLEAVEAAVHEALSVQ